MTDEAPDQKRDEAAGFLTALSEVNGQFGETQTRVEAFTAHLATSFKDMAHVADGFRAQLTAAADDMAQMGTVHDQTTQAMMSSMAAIKSSSDDMAASVTSALKQVVLEGESFGDVMRSLFASITGTALNAAMKPLESFIGAGVQSSLSGLGHVAQSGVSGLFSSIGSFFAPTAFAAGGVVGSPTYFPLAEGLGVAGEAGSEAVLPLTRGSDGRLGVASQGSAQGTTQVTVNIQAQDVTSFRRSQTQISAAIARAVRRGQKSL